jgi:signal transduction histidine kinase/DNA-binding NarL/FixJ family response regulator/HPt (histidine-containing phosphotransfer) domain-containing protein
MARQSLGLSLILRLPAGLCLAVSLAILLGWLAGRADLVNSFSSSQPIPAQGAAMAMLISVAVLMPVTWRRARSALAALAALLATTSMAETLLHVDFGIDWRNPAAWTGADPLAGRATGTSAACMFLLATALVLSPARRRSWQRLATVAVLGLAGLIAMASMLERVLDLGAIYSWHFLNRMPISVAGILVLLILPLWQAREPPDEETNPRDPAAALLSSGTLLLVGVSVLAGSIGLVSMRRGIEDSVRGNLLATVEALGSVFETTIDDRLKFGHLAAARSGLLAAVQRADAEPGNAIAQRALQQTAEDLIGGDVRGVAVFDEGGKLLVTGGHVAEAPRFARVLDGTDGARLVWDDRLLIDISDELGDPAHPAGRLVVEQDLPFLNTILAQAASLGTSGNGSICGLLRGDPSRMECLPNRTNAQPLIDEIAHSGTLLPISNALQGRAGTIDTFDRRGIRVMAAFTPLTRFGLAIDLKVDTVELFAPVRARGVLVVPVLILILLGGSLVLRERIAPLARQLVEREREARERGIALEESRRELLHKNRVLDVALNNMAQGLVLYDANGRLRAFNRRYERMMGFPPGFLRPGLSHTAVRKRSAEFGASAVEDGVAMLLTMGGEANGERQKVERRLRDGRVAEIVHEPLEEGGGVITFSDVTAARAADDALRAAKEGAEAANRAKSEFLSMMSHEVRTPMNGVLGMIRVLLDTSLSAQQRKFADTARSSAEALLAILDDILDFSKLEAGRLVLESVVIDVPGFIDGVLAIMKPLGRDKGLTLDCGSDPELPRWIETDSTRLRQIMLNLLGNAVKFTSEGSVTLRVTVKPAQPQPILSFVVEDTGPGIAHEVLPSLFSRFTQADSSITRKFGGTGLGLAISKQLVELMGGTISVDTALGRGSAFRVDLPCRVPPATPSVAAAPDPIAAAERAAPGRRLKILVAEDNIVNQAVMSAMLATYDHDVAIAEDGMAAVAIAERGDIDLVFMDIQMPEMDGLAATKAIRALPGPIARVPIVALTANAMAGQREEYIAAGMNDYIAKPLRPEDLARVLQRWGDPERWEAAQGAAEQRAGTMERALAPAERGPTEPAVPAPLVDLERVAELSAVMPAEALVAMLDTLFADGEVRLAAMAAASDRHDLDGLRRAAHDIAGVTANCGLAEAEQLARQVVAACRDGDSARASALAAAAMRSVRRAEAPLRKAIGARLVATAATPATDAARAVMVGK